MLFQTLDNKSECVGVYTDNELIFGSKDLPDNLSQTWSYAPYLKNRDIEYAKLYLEGKSLADVLPEYLLEDWEDITKTLDAFNRSHVAAKIDMDDNCFYDLVPTRFLVDLCDVKNKITEHILKKHPKPHRYEFYKHVHMMLRDIEERQVKYDRRLVSSYVTNAKMSGHVKSLLRCKSRVSYNQFGTVTGRLTTKRHSFPILTLPKIFRRAVLPTNDFFVELDFNGAEIRTLIGLLGRRQPTIDIHRHHMKEVFGQSTTREGAKQSFFAWLYGSKKYKTSPEGLKLDTFYDKKSLLDKHYSGGVVTTPYKKQIKNTSQHHALNYLIQSTTAELVLKQALKINYYLEKSGCDSFLAFIVHDAIVLDMKKKDMNKLQEIQHLMSSTNFGTFMINMKQGISLGDLKSG